MPAISTPVGPPPTTTKVSNLCRSVDLDLALGRLEGQEHPAADFGRVFDRLQAGRKRFPFGMAEVTVPGTGGNDERVVADLVAVELYDAIVEVEARYVAQQDVAVCLPRDDRSERRGDIRRREAAGCDLIQQRLEQMEVAAIDERDLNGRSPQRPCRIQAAEAAADDNDVMDSFTTGGVKFIVITGALDLSDWSPLPARVAQLNRKTKNHCLRCVLQSSSTAGFCPA